MKTMQQVTNEYLEEKKTATLKQVWDSVKKEMKTVWAETYEKLSSTDIEKIKIGELYTMLTSYGEFIKNEKDQWSLSKFYSFEEVQKMRINVGEMED